jgi:hypothetical protein
MKRLKNAVWSVRQESDITASYSHEYGGCSACTYLDPWKQQTLQLVDLRAEFAVLK